MEKDAFQCQNRTVKIFGQEKNIMRADMQLRVAENQPKRYSNEELNLELREPIDDREHMADWIC